MLAEPWGNHFEEGTGSELKGEPAAPGRSDRARCRAGAGCQGGGERPGGSLAWAVGSVSTEDSGLADTVARPGETRSSLAQALPVSTLPSIHGGCARPLVLLQ